MCVCVCVFFSLVLKTDNLLKRLFAGAIYLHMQHPLHTPRGDHMFNTEQIVHRELVYVDNRYNKYKSHIDTKK